MQKLAIWATISLLTVGIGIIFYAIGYERHPVTLGTLVKQVVLRNTLLTNIYSSPQKAVIF